MASLNTASLREELEALKGRFERLCAEGKMGEEIRSHSRVYGPPRLSTRRSESTTGRSWYR